MTNSWQDPLAGVLGGNQPAQTGAQHIMPMEGNPQGGGWGSMRDMAMQRLRPSAGGMGGGMQTPGLGQQFGSPQAGAGWMDAAGQFQQQAAAANAQWQAQVMAFQQQMQQMMQQQAQMQQQQQPMMNPAGPPAGGGGYSMAASGDQSVHDARMMSYQEQAARQMLGGQ